MIGKGGSRRLALMVIGGLSILMLLILMCVSLVGPSRRSPPGPEEAAEVLFRALKDNDVNMGLKLLPPSYWLVHVAKHPAFGGPHLPSMTGGCSNSTLPDVTSSIPPTVPRFLREDVRSGSYGSSEARKTLEKMRKHFRSDFRIVREEVERRGLSWRLAQLSETRIGSELYEGGSFHIRIRRGDREVVLSSVALSGGWMDSDIWIVPQFSEQEWENIVKFRGWCRGRKEHAPCVNSALASILRHRMRQEELLQYALFDLRAEQELKDSKQLAYHGIGPDKKSILILSFEQDGFLLSAQLDGRVIDPAAGPAEKEAASALRSGPSTGKERPGAASKSP